MTLSCMKNHRYFVFATALALTCGLFFLKLRAQDSGSVRVGVKDAGFDSKHALKVVMDAAAAAKQSLTNATTVTHLGTGKGLVKDVASNRRILGEDGKVKVTRYTATKNPDVRAMPVGTIDPELKMISFWNGDEAIAELTYYATHPQSYYRTGMASPDFPGLARNAREDETSVPHIHFNGAGGDIGAGKWNDGAKENRQVLADKVAAGMKLAWEGTEKVAIKPSDVKWEVEPVLLPVGTHMVADDLQQIIQNRTQTPSAKCQVWRREGTGLAQALPEERPDPCFLPNFGRRANSSHAG